MVKNFTTSYSNLKAGRMSVFLYVFHLAKSFIDIDFILQMDTPHCVLLPPRRLTHLRERIYILFHGSDRYYSSG